MAHTVCSECSGGFLLRRGGLGVVGSSEGDRGGVNGLCVGGRGSSGDKEGKERKRENREETERGGKGRSQRW